MLKVPNKLKQTFWKGIWWFCHQCLRTFCYFLPPNLRKWLFGNFVSKHLNTDQSQLTKDFALVACFACCSLGNSS